MRPARPAVAADPDLAFRQADALERRARDTRDPAARDVLRDRELAIYARLVTEQRAYARIDEVLFWDADALAARGRADDARAMFERLIAEYPGSKVVRSARVSLGDLRFEHEDLTGALASYRDVGGADELAAYARYRSGWCELNLGNYDAAIADLVASATSPGSDASHAQLVRGARKDVARAFAMRAPDGPIDGARAIFVQAADGDPDAVTAMFDDLARTYCSTGQVAPCIAAMRELAPLPSCAWFERGARALDSSTELLRATDGAEHADAACRDRVATLLGAVAMMWHRDGTAHADPAMLDAAAAVYAADLQRFPAARDAITVTYFAGELAYARDNDCVAAPYYATVARAEPADPNRAEAAYAHVLATLRCEHLVDVAPEASESNTPQPIPPAWQHVLAATELYLERVHPADPAVQFEHARILYAFAHLADAAAALRVLVHDAPKSEVAEPAAVLLRDCEQRLR